MTIEQKILTLKKAIEDLNLYTKEDISFGIIKIKKLLNETLQEIQGENNE